MRPVNQNNVAVTPPDKATMEAYRAQLLQKHNIIRQASNVPALALNTALNKAALIHAHWMAFHNSIEHEEGGGKNNTVGDRVSEQGYAWAQVAENNAEGQPTPTEASRAWLYSPGHKANMIRRDVTEVGFGLWYRVNGNTTTIFWCAVFAKSQAAELARIMAQKQPQPNRRR
jgi:uncharacterized protein YkwD